MKKLSELPDDSAKAGVELNKLVTIALRITGKNEESSRMIDQKKRAFSGEYAPEEQLMSLKSVLGPWIVKLLELKKQIMTFINGKAEKNAAPIQPPSDTIAHQREITASFKHNLVDIRSSDKLSHHGEGKEAAPSETSEISFKKR